MASILVTGASGFVGSALCRLLVRKGVTVRAAVRARDRRGPLPEEVELVEVGEVGPRTDWSAALPGIDAVVHLAARVHVAANGSAGALAEFRRVNVEGTKRLAIAAAEAGVARFVFASSVGVYGKRESASPLAEGDPLDPRNPYSVSKAEAELCLAEIGARAPLEWVIVRPPLVYGANAPANFGRLLRWVWSAWPMPFASTHNLRSLVFVENLADALSACVFHADAAREVFLVSDGSDYSTQELVRALAKGMGRPARLFPIPETLLRASLRAVGKQSFAERLWGSLVVDSRKIRRCLSWTPPIGAEEALLRTARNYAEDLAHRHA